MLTDVMNYLAPSLEFMLESHLVDPQTKQPQYTVVTPDMIWYPKNDPPKLLGFDGNPFDENFVYQQLTELDWKGNYKCFLKGGIRWMPRYMDLSAPAAPIVSVDSSYVQVINGKVGGAANVGRVQTICGLIKAFNFGGDVGIQDCLVVEYEWNDGATLETFYYSGPNTFGWCRWTTANLINGQYVVQQTSNFNTVVKGGFGAVNFTGIIPE